MVHGSPNHGKAYGDVHAIGNAHHLDGPVALIVVHGNDNVKIASSGTEEERIRRQRAFHIPALGLRGFHGRKDLCFFFAIAKQAVFSGMGINGANRDTRIGDARTHKRVVRPCYGTLHKGGLYLVDGVNEAQMGGHVHDPQSGRHEHHRDFGRARQVGQHFRMPRKHAPCRVQGFLVQGGGADGLGLARLHKFHRLLDELVGSFAGYGRNHAERMPLGNNRHIDTINDASDIPRRIRVGKRIDGNRAARDFRGFTQSFRVANHKYPGPCGHLGPGHGLDYDFRPDTGGVAHGNGHNWKIQASSPL